MGFNVVGTALSGKAADGIGQLLVRDSKVTAIWWLTGWSLG